MAHSEKRKTQRVTLPNKAYAVMRPEFEKLGKVLDISLDGLSIEYMDTSAVHIDHAEVDLMVDQDTLLTNLPCRVVYDRPLDEDELSLGLMRRRCGLQLGDLSAKQQKQLSSLLKPSVAVSGGQTGH